MGLTLVEKIAARHADGLPAGTVVRAGDFVSIRPRHVMTHDNTGAVIPKFKQIGATAIADPAQPVFAIDHDIQNITPKNLEKYAKIEAFANEHGIDFYPAGTGISHQVMVEQGYVVPGALVVASDSHSNLYGARGGARHAGGANRCREHLGDGRNVVAGPKGRQGVAQGKTFARALRARMSSSRCADCSIKTKCSITRSNFVGDGVADLADVRAHDDRQHDDGMGRARRRVSVR